MRKFLLFFIILTAGFIAFQGVSFGQAEKRPETILYTASWCTYCRVLESELNNGPYGNYWRLYVYPQDPNPSDPVAGIPYLRVEGREISAMKAATINAYIERTIKKEGGIRGDPIQPPVVQPPATGEKFGKNSKKLMSLVDELLKEENIKINVEASRQYVVGGFVQKLKVWYCTLDSCKPIDIQVSDCPGEEGESQEDYFKRLAELIRDEILEVEKTSVPNPEEGLQEDDESSLDELNQFFKDYDPLSEPDYDEEEWRPGRPLAPIPAPIPGGIKPLWDFFQQDTHTNSKEPDLSIRTNEDLQRLQGLETERIGGYGVPLKESPSIMPSLQTKEAPVPSSSWRETLNEWFHKLFPNIYENTP